MDDLERLIAAQQAGDPRAEWAVCLAIGEVANQGRTGRATGRDAIIEAMAQWDELSGTASPAGRVWRVISLCMAHQLGRSWDALANALMHADDIHAVTRDAAAIWQAAA